MNTNGLRSSDFAPPYRDRHCCRTMWFRVAAASATLFPGGTDRPRGTLVSVVFGIHLLATWHTVTQIPDAHRILNPI
jgi:hypothetical protein